MYGSLGAGNCYMEVVIKGLARLFGRSEEHTSELQPRLHLVCRLLLEKKAPKTRRLVATRCPSHFLTPKARSHFVLGCRLLLLNLSPIQLQRIWLLGSLRPNKLPKMLV